MRELTAVLATSDLGHQERGELGILLGTALGHLHNFDAAAAAFADARVYVFSSASVALEAESYFFESALHLARGEFEQCDDLATRASTLEPQPFDPRTYFVPIEHTIARASQIRGMVAARAERYDVHVEFLHSAIAKLSSCAVSDAWIHASLLRELAYYVRDFDLFGDAMMLREELKQATWPADLDATRCEIYRSLAWSNVLRGNHINALREFRQAAEAAPSDAATILVTVDRAFLRRELGDHLSSNDDLEYAARLAEKIDWSSVGEERIALAFLAQETAAFDSDKARSLMERYLGIRAKLSPFLANSYDRRIVAAERYAEALVLRSEHANGAFQHARIAQLLTEAFEIWASVNYRWHAARAAIDLWQTKPSDRYVSYARREADLRPNSWLARRVNGLVS